MAGDVSRSSADFMQKALSAPAAEFVVLHNYKPAVLICGGDAGSSGSLLRVSAADLVALGALSGGDTLDVAAGVQAIVIGTQAGGSKPVVGIDVTSLGSAPDVLDRLRGVTGASSSGSAKLCGGSACQHLMRAQPCTESTSLSFIDPHTFVFGPTLAGKARRAAAAAAASVPDPATVAAAATASTTAAPAPLWGLRPHELGWPLPFEDLALYGACRALLTFHNKHRFCGSCGTATVSAEGGMKRQCTSATCKEGVYPRTDPVVISLVQSRDGKRCLLGRGRGFPPGFYSILAGFLETAESIEEAVRREVMEEAAVPVGRVRYYASQPWPVTRGGLYGQIMLGCLATAEADADEDVRPDPTELADAFWCTKEEVRSKLEWFYREGAEAAAAAAAGPASQASDATASASDASNTSASGRSFRLPGPFAIAHVLLKAWVNGEADDLLPPAATTA